MGTGDHPDGRVDEPGLGDGLAGLEAVGDGHQQPAGVGDGGAAQHLVIGHVAVDVGNVGLAQALQPVRILLDHHQLAPGLLQAAHQQTADPAIARQYGVAFHLHRRACALGQHLGVVGVRLFLQVALDGVEHQRVEHDGEAGAHQDQVAGPFRHQLEHDGQPDEDEGELADLGQAGGDGEGGALAIAKQPHDGVGRRRLAEHDDEQGGQHRQRLGQQHRRVEQHAHRDEEQHGEGVLQRQGVVGGAVAQLGAVHDDAGEEGAEREGDAEQLDRAEGDAKGAGQYRQGEQLARAGAGGVGQQPGDEAAAHHHHQRHEQAHLAEGPAQIQRYALPAHGLLAEPDVGDDGQHHQRQHHHQILDDEPADGDAPLQGLQILAALQRPQQHHGTGGGESEAEHQAGDRIPPQQRGEPHAEQGGDRDLGDGAWDGDPLYRHQIAKGEVKPHPEHQQDHPQLCQLGHQLHVGHVPRGEGARDDAGRQIAHHGGDLEALGQHAEDVGQHEAADQGGNQGKGVVHVVTSLMAVRGLPDHRAGEEGSCQ